MRLDLVVGPNGAGKSAFVEIVLAPRRPHSGWAFDDAAPPGLHGTAGAPAGSPLTLSTAAAATPTWRLLDYEEP